MRRWHTDRMTAPENRNLPEPLYAQIAAQVAQTLAGHPGEIVILSHVDPDGDALGDRKSVV